MCDSRYIHENSVEVMYFRFLYLIKLLIIYKQSSLLEEKDIKYSDFKAHHKN